MNVYFLQLICDRVLAVSVVSVDVDKSLFKMLISYYLTDFGDLLTHIL